MNIILIRHGETEWNLAGRKQGHKDSPLTAAGCTQARSYGRGIVERIGKYESWQFICSPLGRTMTTASIISAELNLPSNCFQAEPLLMEGDHGDWEGLTVAEIDAKYPNERKIRQENYWTYKMPNGESYCDIDRRVTAWMSRLPTDAQIVVVTHAMVSRCIRGQYLGLRSEDCVLLPRHPHGCYYHLVDGCMKECTIDA